MRVRKRGPDFADDLAVRVGGSGFVPLPCGSPAALRTWCAFRVDPGFSSPFGFAMKKPLAGLLNLAVREGFEPSIPDKGILP